LKYNEEYLMPVFKRDRSKKRLTKLLGMSELEELTQLIWAVDAIQSGRADKAIDFLRFPPDAASNRIDAQKAIHKWELETIFGERLRLPASLKKGRRSLKCNEFSSAANLVNALRKLEDSESGMLLKRRSVFEELHRISHRQFPWQRGYLNVPHFYRSAFIYGHDECRGYFEATYDVDMDKFSLVGFGLFAAFYARPLISPKMSLEFLGVSEDELVGACRLMVASTEKVSQEYEDLLKVMRADSLDTAYRPCVLRKFPIIEFDAHNPRLRCPLPQLIIYRITNGLYYDIVGGGQRLLNEASDRFEQYSSEFIQAMMPAFQVSRASRYVVGLRNFETPDIFVKSNGGVEVIIECKATKLSFQAQFGADLVSEADRGLREIAKGVFQIWRYISHVRLGYVSEAMSPAVRNVVLTLDTWVMMSRDFNGEILAVARRLAEADPDISPEDMRPIIICSIEDLEATFRRASEQNFLDALTAAVQDRFSGWLLSSIDRELTREAGVERQPRPFPFELGNVLPWWAKTDDLRRATNLANSRP
jgi:hypothetical protein